MRITKNVLFLFILFVSSIASVRGQALICEKFKDGTFKIKGSEGGPETTLYRKGKVQIETIKGSEGYSEFVVKWLDDCTYTLKPTKKTLKRFTGLPKNACLTVKIIEVKDSSYIQVSTSNFANYELTSEVLKIN